MAILATWGHRVFRRTPVIATCLLVTAGTSAQVTPPIRIDNETPGLEGVLSENGQFGTSVVSLGDLDGDGMDDLAVGAPQDDNQGDRGPGSVWILFLNQDLTVKRHHKISYQTEDLGLGLGPRSQLGQCIANLGDLDGDGVPELIAGANYAGTLRLMYLRPDGTVKSGLTIGPENAELQVPLADRIGYAVADLGDVDGDGVSDLALGATQDDDGGNQAGAIWIAFMYPDGTVRARQKINSTHGNFTETIEPLDFFGWSVARLGDLDRDGVPDVAVGARWEGEDTVEPEGAVYVLFLTRDGTVKRHVRIKIEGTLELAYSVAAAGDLDGDGSVELAVGDPRSDSVWILFLNMDGTVRSSHEITKDDLGVEQRGGRFGYSVAPVGDLNSDGVVDLAIGAHEDAFDRTGGLWVFFGLPTPVKFEDRSAVAIMGNDARVSVEITDLGGVTNSEISFRRGGDESFFSAPMSNLGNGQFEFDVPAFAVSSRGLEYFLTVTETEGSEKRVPGSGVVSIPVLEPDGLTAAIEGREEYRLVSIPLDLADKQAATVFEDNLGPYDKTSWRFFSLSLGERLTELNELPLEMTSGSAYWLSVRDAGKTFNTGPGTSNRTDQPYFVNLNPGWNLVGNPFTFPIPLSNLRTERDQPVELFAYDGTWSIEEEAIEPFSGYAIYSDGADSLLVDPDLTPSNVGQGASENLRRASFEWKRRELEALFGFLSTDEQPAGHTMSVSAYPSPSFGSITIEFELREASQVMVTVYDVLGRRRATLLDDAVKTGRQSVLWDGRDDSGGKLAPGTYFYRVSAGGIKRAGPIVLAR